MPRRRLLAAFLFAALLGISFWLRIRPGTAPTPDSTRARDIFPSVTAAATAPAGSRPPAPPEAPTAGVAPYSAPTDVFTDPPPIPARYDVPSRAENARRWAPLAPIPAPLALSAGARLALPLFDGRLLEAEVKLARTEDDGRFIVAGSLLGDSGGTFSLAWENTSLTGLIVPASGDLAYTLELDSSGRTLLVERAKDAVLCPRLPVTENAADTSVQTAAAATVSAAVPVLSSRPSAPAVIYLDFDGETVTDPLWNSGTTITATASGLDSDQITQVWRRVAEDYRAFDVDVTTDLARYNAVAARYRMRCIVTQTSSWFGSAGGVAYVSSWRQAGSGSFSSNIPCWVFADMLATSPRYIAEAASHEVGHTLGLSHDGLKDSAGTTTDDYYDGRGSGDTSWAPIMGVGYYVNLAQWSKGDYADGSLVANNTEDDLALITSTSNHVSYLTDDAGGTIATAILATQTSASAIDHSGLVERTSDADYLKFSTAAGTVSLSLVADVTGSAGVGLPDLDASLTLYDSAGNQLAAADPTGSLRPSLSATVAAGTYYLRVLGVGEGDPLATGYSAYGSIGPYHLVGTVVAAAPAVSAATASATVGTAFSLQISATGVPSSYSAQNLPPGLSINPTSGLISGTPTLGGDFSATVTASNSAGSGSATVSFTVSGSLPSALDDTALSLSNGGASFWREDAGLAVVAGTSAARSGPVSDGGESWFEFTVSGPGALAFSWKISSEADHDYVRVLVDGVETASASGELDWTRRTLVFTANTSRVVRFSYIKDGSGSAGADAAWIDSVVFTPDYDRVVESPALAWNSGGTLPWKFDATQSHSGGASLRSGAITHSQESWLEATLQGPGVLTFWWRVSSQTNNDRLRVNLDGVEQANISGTATSATTWAQRTLAIGAGAHLVRWRYTKNASTSSGSDAGWIDDLVYTVPPVIADASIRAATGHAFSYQINAANFPVSYAASGLPAGLSLDSASGIITGTPTVAGDYSVALSATNAAGTGSATLALRVVTPYVAWTEDHALATTTETDDANNLLAYAFAIGPASSSGGTLPASVLVTEGESRYLALDLVIPADRADLAYTVQTSDDLVSWTDGQAYGAASTASGDLPTVEEENILASDGSRHIRVRDATPLVEGARRFIRVRVEVAP